MGALRGLAASQPKTADQSNGDRSVGKFTTGRAIKLSRAHSRLRINSHRTPASPTLQSSSQAAQQQFVQGPNPPSSGSSPASAQTDAVCSREAVYQALRIEGGADELQDFLASVVLSECVYKKLEGPEEDVVKAIGEYASQFPGGWLQLQAVQLSLSGIPQHYLLAVGGNSLYVAFMGTKQPRDLVTDVNLLQEAVWAEAAALAADRKAIPAAHRGFLARSRAINIQQLYELAASSGRKLVLCGHSLGGAVAKLCALRLLRELPEFPPPNLRCISFATPAVGNSALAELVENAGWASHFKTYYLPEDQLMKAVSFYVSGKHQRPPMSAAAASTAAVAAVTSLDLPAEQAARESSSMVPVGAEEGGFTPQVEPTSTAAAAVPPAPIPAAIQAAMLAAMPPATAWAASSSAAGPELQPQPLQSMQEEEAVEEILSKEGPTEGSVCATVEQEAGEASTYEVVQEAGAQALPQAGSRRPRPPFNLGLTVALQRRRAMRHVMRLARLAKIPLPAPPVSRFHAFGQQVFVCQDGAFTALEMQTRGPSSESAAPSLPETVGQKRGPFSYHRMRSYRHRTLHVIRHALAQYGLELPTASASTPVPLEVALSTGLFPSMMVQRAVARLPLQLDSPTAAGTMDTAAGATPSDSVQTAPAALGRGLLKSKSGSMFPSFTPSFARREAGKLPLPLGRGLPVEDTVSLLIHVHGHYLNYSREVTGWVRSGGAAAGASDGTTTMVQVQVVKQQLQPDSLLPDGDAGAVGGSSSSSRTASSMHMLQSGLHNLAGAIGRMLRPGATHVEAHGSSHGSDMSSPLLLRVDLPRAVLQQLQSVCARPFHAKSQKQQGGGLASSSIDGADSNSESEAVMKAASPAAANNSSAAIAGGAELWLRFKSDFQELAVQVELSACRVGVIGTSTWACTLLHVALASGPSPASAAAEQPAKTTPWSWLQPSSWLPLRKMLLSQQEEEELDEGDEDDGEEPATNDPNVSMQQSQGVPAAMPSAPATAAVTTPELAAQLLAKLASLTPTFKANAPEAPSAVRSSGSGSRSNSSSGSHGWSHRSSGSGSGPSRPASESLRALAGIATAVSRLAGTLIMLHGRRMLTSVPLQHSMLRGQLIGAQVPSVWPQPGGGRRAAQVFATTVAGSSFIGVGYGGSSCFSRSWDDGEDALPRFVLQTHDGELELLAEVVSKEAAQLAAVTTAAGAAPTSLAPPLQAGQLPSPMASSMSQKPPSLGAGPASAVPAPSPCVPSPGRSPSPPPIKAAAATVATVGASAAAAALGTATAAAVGATATSAVNARVAGAALPSAAGQPASEDVEPTLPPPHSCQPPPPTATVSAPVIEVLPAGQTAKSSWLRLPITLQPLLRLQQPLQRGPATPTCFSPSPSSTSAAAAPAAAPAAATAPVDMAAAPVLAFSGGVLYHNLMADLEGVVDAFALLRRLAAALRRQGLELAWWRWALDGVQHIMRPAALLHAAQYLGGLPFAGRRAQWGLAEQALNQEWAGLVVVASVADSTRLLQSREMRLAAVRAQQAKVPLLPVLLTSPRVPAARQAASIEALSQACGVAPSAVRLVTVDDSLLRPSAHLKASQGAPVLSPEPEGLQAVRQAIHQVVSQGGQGSNCCLVQQRAGQPVGGGEATAREGLPQARL